MLPFYVFGSLGMGVGYEFPLLSRWVLGGGEFSLLWFQGFVEGVRQSWTFSPLFLVRSSHSFVESS